ncbi:MAG: hypothetical protein HY697_04740, partial [Deltaproteobacteria bacterium]|nr:hypothetical protein [Deltaproteobacteria bacterium]
MSQPLDRVHTRVARSGGTFWQSGADGVLRLPRCGACRKPFWYPRTNCPRCGGDAIAWVETSGRGTVHTFTIDIMAMAAHRALADAGFRLKDADGIFAVSPYFWMPSVSLTAR